MLSHIVSMSFICSKGSLSHCPPLAAAQSPRTAPASPGRQSALAVVRRASTTLARFSACRWTFCNEKPIFKSTQCSSLLSFGESYFCLSSSETKFQNMGGRGQSQCLQLRREHITPFLQQQQPQHRWRAHQVGASGTGSLSEGFLSIPFRNRVCCHGY